jgi:hypothetical protein
MTYGKTTYIDGGSAQYWQVRRIGFALVRPAERAAKEMAEAPQYISGGYEADGDQIAIEILAPTMISMKQSGPWSRTRRQFAPSPRKAATRSTTPSSGPFTASSIRRWRISISTALPRTLANNIPDSSQPQAEM